MKYKIIIPLYFKQGSVSYRGITSSISFNPKQYMLKNKKQENSDVYSNLTLFQTFFHFLIDDDDFLIFK